MKCERAHSLIHAEFDGESNAQQQRALQAHIETCEACRTLQAQFQAMAEGFEWLAQESEMAPQTAPAIIRLLWVRRVAIAAAAAAMVLWVAWPFSGPSEQTRLVSNDESAPHQRTESNFEFELVGESFDKYLAVEQEPIVPNVHIVWLHRNQGFSEESSSAERFETPLHS